MKPIGIIANLTKEKAPQTVSELSNWLHRRNIAHFITEDCANILGNGNYTILSQEDLIKQSSYVIVFGGDGTLLNMSRIPGAVNVPILAVNLGSLGFLTEVTLDELYPALTEILAGNFQLDERMMLQAMLRDKSDAEVKAQSVALNDAVISNGPFSRIISLETYIDDEYVATYNADGLIIATPSGSTAYSLSAGGPIMHPGLGAFVLTPICPHTLTLRPLIVSSESCISVVIRSTHSNITLTVDGQEDFGLNPDCVVEIKRAAETVKLIRSRKRSYYEVLKTKLKWGSVF